ncbi:MAG: 3-dehydroquinate synthase [Clostridia bacterium]|nr:3-dehydroquinate synthase [Clostridia bacterium]
MQNLRVNIPNREYDIKIGKGLLSKAGELISAVHSPCRTAIITDSNVAPLYLGVVCDSLKKSGFTPFKVVVDAGEASKSIRNLEFLYAELLKNNLTRSDLIIALGGGVVGDLAGFCAATLLRGIPFVQIPTTLLAQVDSSVGGKVAVNLSSGKNLVGAFYQPQAVIIDPNCLATLSDKIFSDGMAEVIKYGVILDLKLFEKLEAAASRQGIMEIIEAVIYRCCDLKRTVVEADEYDLGKRMILNFGHTFGHAIEKKYNFTDYTHGEAVAAGMVMAAEYGEKIGITKEGTAKRIRAIVSSFGLPQDIPLNQDDFSSAAAVDKKGKGDFLSLILPEEIGKVIIKDTEKDSIWIK